MKKSQMMTVAALTVPALTALLVPRLGIGSAPARARANDGAAPLSRQPFAAHSMKPSPEQRAAMVRIAELSGGAVLESPFLEPTQEMFEEGKPAVDEGPDWAAEIARVVRMTSVFGSPRGDAAVINGKFYFKGTEIIEGVAIESIDVAGRSVIVVTADGARFQLGMAARSGDPTVVTRVK